jgi:putative drug exporter of the RND superfamily
VTEGGAAPERGSYLRPVARLVTRWPRLVIAAWIAVVATLSFFGLGLDQKLSTKPILIDGTEAKRQHEISTRAFGDNNALFVLLSGPPAAIERQGRELERRLDRLPQTRVIAPWDRGGLTGLRPAPDELALLLHMGLAVDEGVPDLVPPVREIVDEVVRAPVEANLGGGPAVVEAFRDAAAHAAAVGERIAIPALLLILLFVFRSVLAALLPVIVGGAVVASTRGVLDLLLPYVEIDAFALGAVGMMGLALGVDYSLLIVSRFREEIRDTDDVAAAVRETIVATGRSVVPAGGGLILAMAVTPQVLPGTVVTSVAVSVVVAAMLSVLSALLVTPAMLMVLGKRLDRWVLPGRTDEEGAASRWSGRLSTRPKLVWPILIGMLFAAVWAVTLNSEVGTAKLLPPGDSGRQQEEAVQGALGPGWISPTEIAMVGGDEPVTTPRRLRALSEFQSKVEADPGVASMAGFDEIERQTRPLGRFEENLVAQQRGIERLGRGLARTQEGTRANSDGLLKAASGAATLDSGLGESENGAGLLVEGMGKASDGSERLSGGLDRADDGSGKLASGTEKASGGAGRLSEGLAKAARESEKSANNARVLRNAMETGKGSLAGLNEPIQSTETQLSAARAALERMDAGRTDPEYAAALAAVDAASRSLTGTDPASGERVDPAYEGVQAGVTEAESQFDLGIYLADELGESSREGSEGLGKLSRSSAKLDDGLQRLSDASDQLSGAIAQLADGGQELSPALRRLTRGTGHLAGGLGQLQDGAAGLAAGLGDGAQRSTQLTGALGKMRNGIDRGGDSGSGIEQLNDGSPGLFDSGFFYLASLDGSKPEQRRKAEFLVNIDQGGGVARMLVIPRYDPSTAQARETSERIEADADELAAATGAEVAVGGVGPMLTDIDTALRDQAPLARLLLCLVTIVVLLPVVRSLTLALVAAVLNLLTVSAAFGLLALLFNDSLLGGPGFVDTTVVPATIVVIFGLAIDYEVFLFARMREEYERTGSPSAAIANGIGNTAHVITGAAFIMIVVFLIFATSSFATLRQFGVAQALAVFIDAFIVRLIVLPMLMRAMGRWTWWMPRWLDRLLPGRSLPAPTVGTA